MISHDKAELADKIRLLGELEHARYHFNRAAISAEEGSEDEIHYHVLAERAKAIRRKIQEKWLPPLSELDWCAVKVAASIKQLANEISMQPEDRREIEDFCDAELSHALGVDMSGCLSCREDSGAVSDEEEDR